MNDTEHAVRDSWGRIAAWLRGHGQPGPHRAAADTERLAAAEAELGLPMPEDLRAWWRLDDVAATFWIPLEFVPVDLGEALSARDILVQVAGDEAEDTGGLANAAQYLPALLPIADSPGGDHLLVDLRPGPTHGAVFLWNHEEWGLGVPLWDSVTEMLADTARALTTGAPALTRHAARGGTERPCVATVTGGLDWDDADLDIAGFTSPCADRPPTPVPVDWETVEEWLGVRLPGDYRQLADRHGPLDFGEYLWIHVPCADGRFDYGDWLRETHRQARSQLRALPEDERPRVHPEPGGLLAWGSTRGGDMLFWDTSASDDPDAWPVVQRHAGAIPGSGLRDWHRYDLTLTAYLRHAVRESWESPTPPGPLLQLPGTVARTAFLDAAQPWTPPAPVDPRLGETERRVALETGTGLDALRLLTPPPERAYLGDGTWEQLFDTLGSRLPREYVRLMEVYGSGCWSGWLRFPAPLRTAAPRFMAYVEETLEAYGDLKDGSPDWYPLNTWPEPDGFLPFADSIDGDHLGWLTRGEDPDAWPLIFWPRHADQGPALRSGLVDVLLAWQRGRLVTPGLCTQDEDDDPVEFAAFEPWAHRDEG
ncbi:SMI1/KNR4 family protein [Streptomyces sp. HD]|uniref:SMI1/KNR4 family protein n=1 Tax=Streptomyces sp. HD TaxID=3020892 RepID=UPI0023313606|nr:SMI1/KNR4 family protein [Streptomyces sp. HD]MDC0767728.1 SMI1/KNR4 family protein [Streptomyces sp. HD]